MKPTKGRTTKEKITVNTDMKQLKKRWYTSISTCVATQTTQNIQNHKFKLK